jgi:sialate O-acetylesterase
LKQKGGDSLYGAMIRRFELIGGKVAGVLWYQGESDASVVRLK